MRINGSTLIISDDREFFDTDTLNRPDPNSKYKICQTIKKVVIGKSLSLLQSYDRNPEPFNEYSNLERIEVSPDNTTFRDIDGVLFSKDGTRIITFPDCHSSEYIIPDSVIDIDRSAFDYAKHLETISFGINVKNIGLAAFFHCKKLQHIALSPDLATIGPGAFSFCSSLNELELPPNIHEIGHSLFYECESLESLFIANCSGKRYKTIDGVLFDSSTDSLFRVPPSYKHQKYAIPGTTKIISDYAFHSCNNIEEIVIPESISSISGASLSMTTNLQKITVDKANRYFCDIDGVLFSKDKKRLIAYPGGRHGAYTVPDFVQELGDYCFYSVIFIKKNLTLTIPNEMSIKKGLSVFNPKTEYKEDEDDK